MAVQNVILVHINFPAGHMEEDLEEFRELAISAGAHIVAIVIGTRRVPASKYFVGLGKAEEIREAVSACGARLVLFNHILSPAQERNLERLINCRVLDRTGLILDIFAQRAISFEGKLQVELAMLNHLLTRLVRGWSHLERQRGGIGLRGPGETQLETDRRLIRVRIKTIKERLSRLRKQRREGRRARKKRAVPTVALVGYTNVGKSTLFNCLTNSQAYVANQLFATLDPTLRRIDFPEIGQVILADTVGFIRHLPHELILAFYATLEEVSEADLLLHVIDAHDEDKNKHIEQVNRVLERIGAETVPRILVYNKIDLCTGLSPRIDRDEASDIKRVFISAHKSLGLDYLLSAISEGLGREVTLKHLRLSPNDARLRARLYAEKVVLSETLTESGDYDLLVRMARRELEKLTKYWF